MPCNSDYMNPTDKEQQLRKTSRLLVWVKTKLGKAVPEYAKKAAEDFYGKGGERAVKELCATLNQMNTNKRDALIYGNAKDPIARELADWWEKHQKADEARRESEWAEHDDMRAGKIARAKLGTDLASRLGITPKTAGSKIKRLKDKA